MNLPPLPEPKQPADAMFYIDGQDLFTADQVLSIRAEAVRVALEQAARIAETPVSGEQDDITMQAKDRAAAAIRALKGAP